MRCPRKGNHTSDLHGARKADAARTPNRADGLVALLAASRLPDLISHQELGSGLPELDRRGALRHSSVGVRRRNPRFEFSGS